VERETFPSEFRHLATSLRSHCGRKIDRADFTRRLFCRLEEVLEVHADAGFAGIREQFEWYFRMRGRSVRVVEMDGGEQPGIARGIASDGALEIETPSGEIRRVIAGDVTLAKEDPAP
jgi:BirA family biotin operon repressor/biotin-[acetyl-CoA-carboxylase] ligase